MEGLGGTDPAITGCVAQAVSETPWNGRLLLNTHFAGRVVRKDLTQRVKEGANVPVYVLEYLLGMYCATDDPEVIDQGLLNVKKILADNYVRPDEAEMASASSFPGLVETMAQ